MVLSDLASHTGESLSVLCTVYLATFQIMIETERLAFQDQQKQQKTQMLLGPGVAAGGGPALGPPPI